MTNRLSKTMKKKLEGSLENLTAVKPAGFS